MLILYKQYVQKEDVPLIRQYMQLCISIGVPPILFTDNIFIVNEDVINLTIFHTLYLTRLSYTKIVCLLDSEPDRQILESLPLHKKFHLSMVPKNGLSIDIINKLKELI